MYTCIKCDSPRIIVLEEKEELIKNDNGDKKFEFQVRICADCGFIERYLLHAQEYWKEIQMSKR